MSVSNSKRSTLRNPSAIRVDEKTRAVSLCCVMTIEPSSPESIFWQASPRRQPEVLLLPSFGLHMTSEHLDELARMDHLFRSLRPLGRSLLLYQNCITGTLTGLRCMDAHRSRGIDSVADRLEARRAGNCAQTQGCSDCVCDQRTGVPIFPGRLGRAIRELIVRGHSGRNSAVDRRADRTDDGIARTVGRK